MEITKFNSYELNMIIECLQGEAHKIMENPDQSEDDDEFISNLKQIGGISKKIKDHLDKIN